MIATLRRSSRATESSVVVNGSEVAIGGHGDCLSVPGNVWFEVLSRTRNRVRKVAVVRRLCDRRDVEQ
jgi:hypothetical protein